MAVKLVEPFDNAEHAWFWHLRALVLVHNGKKDADAASGPIRPCEPHEVFKAACLLRRQDILKPWHMEALNKTGMEDYSPTHKEQRHFREAMRHMQRAFTLKGIVQRGPNPYMD